MLYLKCSTSLVIYTWLAIDFGCMENRVEDISTRDGRVSGVKLGDGTSLEADAVVLAVGHSARTLYSCLMNQGVQVRCEPITGLLAKSMGRVRGSATAT